MSIVNDEMIILAWKDPQYRASLTPEQQAAIPEAPSGKSLRELSEDDLGVVVGGVEAPSDPCSCHCCSCHCG